MQLHEIINLIQIKTFYIIFISNIPYFFFFFFNLFNSIVGLLYRGQTRQLERATATTTTTLTTTTTTNNNDKMKKKERKKDLQRYKEKT